MNWKPQRISTKVVIPLVLLVVTSLGLVFILLTRHTQETVIRLNTAALQLETKRLYHFCEKAVEALIVDHAFGDPKLMNEKKEVVLSEIETHLLAEGIDGAVLNQQHIMLSTIAFVSNPEFEGASGTFEINSKEGLLYGYYLYFPVWEWHLVTLLHEGPYWASHHRTRIFLASTAVVYLFLGFFVLLILWYGLQRPLSTIVDQLKANGRISLKTGTRELDLLASTINSQLESILKEGEAKAERKKIEHELEIARNIQQSLLPDSCPKIKGLDVAAIALPAMQVGGDFYDFIPLNDDRIGLVIADVSGKGMPAALFMALSRALIRVNATQEHAITTVIEKTNHLIQEFSSSGYFVTLFYAIADSNNSSLQYIRAGHNPPLFYKAADNEIMSLKGRGVALGVFDDLDLEAKHRDLASGDILLLFTDGVTEAINPLNKEFGVGRLSELLRKNRHLAASAIINEIKQEIETFADGVPQFDDITLVVLKVVEN